MNYYINFHTGAGRIQLEAEDLYAAMEEAEDRAGYTETSITIEDEEENVLASRSWYGVGYNEEEDEGGDDDSRYGDIIEFGGFGYYDRWILL